MFAIKGSRFISHMKGLKDVEKPLANFLASGLFNLREKTGPFLWQFPPQRHAIEIRHESFLDPMGRSHPRVERRRRARGRAEDLLRFAGRAYASRRRPKRIRFDDALTPPRRRAENARHPKR